VGVDGSSLERDATRTRRMVATGMTFRDPIWPGLEQDALGAFAEWEGPLSDSLSVRAGMRIDHWTTEATRAGERIVPGPGYGPTTVERAYRDVGGLTGEVDQDDLLTGGNLRFSLRPAENWRIHLGLGYTEAAPNLTQRYQAFGPVPGGFGIGTPDLKPETKQEIELRVEHIHPRFRFGAAVHASQVDDYLLSTTVAKMDVNGDGISDRVRGTVNRDARLWGAEVDADLQLTEQLHLPMQAGWVQGEESDSGDALPEIPPFEATAALDWRGESDWHPTGRLETRYVHKQDRVSAAFGEDTTPSFALVHLRGSIQPTDTLTLEAGIENLLDRLYHEHLTREALLPVGDLAAGDEISGPGRTFYLNVRVKW
jgi:iron complex outermembrane receptor protein